MYTPVALEYRVAIRITVGGAHYYFSRRYFMSQFEQFVAKHLVSDKRKKLRKADGQHTLDSVDDFLLASRSFDETVNKNTLWYFKIADRKIAGGYHKDRYLRDEDLSGNYQTQFRVNGATYPEMSKFVNSGQVQLNSPGIAHQMIEVCLGERDRTDDCPLIPLMLAVTLIAEPSRNQLVFLPALMLLDLIRHNHIDCFGEVYTLKNSLCSPVLARSEREASPPCWSIQDVLLHHLNMPTQREVDHAADIIEQRKQGARIPVPEMYIPTEDRSFFNVGGQYNGSKEHDNTSWIRHSDAAMRVGGWFSMAARYSFLELLPHKRYRRAAMSQRDFAVQQAATDGEAAFDETITDDQLPRELTSHIKSFCVISDWLHMRGVAMPMHISYVQRFCRLVPFDNHPEILTSVFKDLYNSIGSYLSKPDGSIFMHHPNDTNQGSTSKSTGSKRRFHKAEHSLDHGVKGLVMREEPDPRIAFLINRGSKDKENHGPVDLIPLDQHGNRMVPEASTIPTDSHGSSASASLTEDPKPVLSYRDVASKSLSTENQDCRPEQKTSVRNGLVASKLSNKVPFTSGHSNSKVIDTSTKPPIAGLSIFNKKSLGAPTSVKSQRSTSGAASISR
ncbi:MAG TPA: hypothetical protein DCW33_00430 [Proteobacteria bacterium]|nr:hypothetical protein [Pseudomonadota bacterium]